MSRIIKANRISFEEDVVIVDVPEINKLDDEEESGDEEPETVEETIQMAQERANDIINNAHAAAESLVMEASERTERERLETLKEASEKGYEEGYAKAVEVGEGIIEEANQTLQDALDEKERLLRQIEPDAVALIIDIIKKLTGDIVRLNPGVIAHIVRTGLNGAPSAKELTVRVSASDFETVEKMKEEICGYVDSDTELTIVKDTSLMQGACIIDTPVGSVESSIDAQIKGLELDLTQMLKMNTQKP